MVYSGFRFVRVAHDAGLPIGIVRSAGRTRGDDLAELKIEGDVGSTLTRGGGRDRRESDTQYPVPIWMIGRAAGSDAETRSGWTCGGYAITRDPGRRRARCPRTVRIVRIVHDGAAARGRLARDA